MIYVAEGVEDPDPRTRWCEPHQQRVRPEQEPLDTLRTFLADWWKAKHAFQTDRPGPFLLVLETTAPEKRASSFSTTRLDGAKLVASSVLDLPVFEVKKRPRANAFALMITIGRAANNDIVLDCEGVSKFHAYFVQQDEEWHVADHSSNGTFLGAQRLESRVPTRVSGDTQILFGKVRCRFLLGKGMYELLELQRQLGKDHPA